MPYIPCGVEIEITYEQIWEWVFENFDVNNYWIVEDLMYDVKNEFAKTNSPFPIQAEELIRERFYYRDQYAEMQEREDEKKQIAEYIGGGQIYESISDEILDDLNKPEILGVDISEYATTKETVVPPDIIRYYKKETFFGRLASRFRNIFRRN